MIIASLILDKEREKTASKAYKRANEQNKAYYKRMRAALDAGEDFNEPPPQFGDDAN